MPLALIRFWNGISSPVVFGSISTNGGASRSIWGGTDSPEKRMVPETISQYSILAKIEQLLMKVS